MLSLEQLHVALKRQSGAERYLVVELAALLAGGDVEGEWPIGSRR
jgi:hypothetical protein